MSDATRSSARGRLFFCLAAAHVYLASRLTLSGASVHFYQPSSSVTDSVEVWYRSDMSGHSDAGPRMVGNMGVALELRAILAGAAAREVDRSSIFGCSPPPRDSFPLIRDDSFTKRLASSRASTPAMSSCSQVAWAGSSHADSRFGSCNSPCSVAPTASALSTA